MKKRRSLWSAILVGTLVLTASGCAAISANLQGDEALPAPPMEFPGEMEVPVEEAGWSGGGGADVAAADYAASIERMVIRTADMDLVVPDTDQALQQIQDLAEELGGYVVSLSTYQYQEGVQADLTFRVPVESFDEALARLRDLATTVRRESAFSNDVTGEYVDLEARLRHLRAKEEQLLEFLDQAEDTEAVLSVYEHLSDTQEEIERVTGRMQYLENQVALATINVNLTPDAMAQPLEVGGWNLPETFRRAVEVLLDVLRFFVKALIYLVIVGVPAIILFVVPAFGLVILVRRLVRRRWHQGAGEEQAPD